MCGHLITQKIGYRGIATKIQTNDFSFYLPVHHAAFGLSI